MTTAEHLSIGVWTGTELSRWHDDAYRILYLRELTLRLPDARVQFFGPLSVNRVDLTEQGHLITSLGAGSESGGLPHWLVMAGTTLNAETLSATVATHENGRRRPTLWSGVAVSDSVLPEQIGRLSAGAACALHIAVRDPCSRQRLVDAGVDQDIDVIPDPLVLFPRLTTPGEARSRVVYVRTMDDYPSAEPILLVEPGPALQLNAETLSRDVTRVRDDGYRLSVVALPGDQGTVPADMRELLDRIFKSVHYLRQRPTLADFSAIIASASGVIASSPEMLVAAYSFGRPTLPLTNESARLHCALSALTPGALRLISSNVVEMLKTRVDQAVSDPDRGRIDAHFDRLAGMLRPSDHAERRDGVRQSSRLPREQLERVHTARGRSLVDERFRFAQRAEGLLDEIAALKAEIVRREVLEARIRRELGDALGYVGHEQWRQASRLVESNHPQAPSDLSSGDDVVQALSREVAELRAMVQRFERSKSWRYLAPVRAAAARLRRLLRVQA